MRKRLIPWSGTLYTSQWNNLVSHLYNGIESCVVNNGHISRFFKPSRGVRQGCPISPYLFIIGAEILAMYIRQCGRVPPIQVSIESTAISQYADDTNIMTFRDNTILTNLMDILNSFGLISGLRVNQEKTQIMCIGGNPHRLYGIDGTCQVSSSIHILGVHISCSKERMIFENYTPVLEKIRHSLNMWSQRQLSILGKIEVVKSQAISRLVYIMSLVPTPKAEFMVEVERLLFHFIWSNKPAKIRKTILKSTKDMGGLDMVDLFAKDTSLKLSWLTRLLSCEGNWKEPIMSSLPNIDLEYLLQCNMTFDDFPCKLNVNSIWRDVFSYWCAYNYKSIDHLNRYANICNTNIWFNSNVKIGKKVVFWRDWYDKGITKLSHLFKGNRFYTYEELVAKYNIKSNFLNYMGLISAIPGSWKYTVRHTSAAEAEEHNDHTVNPLLTFVTKYAKPSSLVYKNIVNDLNDQPWDRFNKWEKDINMEIFDTDIDWYKHIVNWYYCTKSVELRSFIYNYNMRNIVTQKYLCKIGKEASDRCLKCETAIEDILHMFWNCEHVAKLWMEVNAWLSSKLKIKIPNNRECIMMHDFTIINDTAMYEDLLSFIYTLCKRTIYINRQSPVSVSLYNIINVIKKYEYIERTNAIRSKQLQKHFDKWLDLFVLWSNEIQ